MGGGPTFTLSLLELLDLLERETGERIEPAFAAWRPSDQRVYVSDIRRAHERLGWAPKTPPERGVRELAAWVAAHRDRFGDFA
jgi:CDP-paratose 2-epimerase